MYTKTAVVTANVTTAAAVQYNSLMAELKAAMCGVSTHTITKVYTYAGGSTADLIDTVTITDNSPAGDAGFDITGVGTWTYDANDYITTFVYVFSAGEMNVTLTTTYTYDGSNNITTVADVMS